MGRRLCPQCNIDTSEAICPDCGLHTIDEDLMRDSGDPVVGKLIGGRYRVLQRLGAGGMGTVYVAEQIAMKRLVALKVIHTRPSDTSSERAERFKRFQREALATSRLEHHNTVRVFDFGMGDDGDLYLAMELLHGNTLTKVMQAGPMPPERVVRIAVQVCKSLSEAHQKGIVHRDLKPDNIMIFDAEGEQDFVKVLDFGIAKFKENPGESTVTQFGAIIGTPAYMAPEQATGANIVPATDLYSLGIIIFEALTGHPPFDGHTPLAVLMKHVNDPVPSIVEGGFPPDVPIELEDLVLKLLRKDASQRFNSAKEVIEALARIPGIRVELAATNQTPIVRRKLNQKRWPFIAGGIALGIGILVLLAFFSLSSPAPKEPTNLVKTAAEPAPVKPVEAVRPVPPASEGQPAPEVQPLTPAAEGQPVQKIEQATPPVQKAPDPVRSDRQGGKPAASNAVKRPKPQMQRCDRSRCPISGPCQDESGTKVSGAAFCSDISF